MTDIGGKDANPLSFGRIAAALALGAAAGGILTVLVFVISAYAIPNDFAARSGFDPRMLVGWLAIGLIAILGWAIGLLLIGGPVWFLLHRVGLRTRFHAMLVGALLAGTAGYVLAILAGGAFPVAWFVLFSLVGAIVGFLVRKITYR